MVVCNSKFHSPSCPSYYSNNALKGASAVANKILKFDINEVKLMSKTLEYSKQYVKDLVQNNDDILSRIDKSISILNKKGNLKGASSVCPEKSLNNIKNLIGLYQ